MGENAGPAGRGVRRRRSVTAALLVALAVSGGVGAWTARAIADDDPWLMVEGGDHATCGIRSDHTLWCWGANDLGVVGIGRGVASAPEPTRVGDRRDWAEVSVTLDHACGVTRGGTRFCWGQNATGQLGTGDTAPRWTPQRILDGITWAAVSVGGDIDHDARYEGSSCGLSAVGLLYCWGSNDRGQLGVGSTADSTMPVHTDSGAWSAVSVGTDFACGVGLDGGRYCWGRNDHGELGLGDTVDRAVPQRSADEPAWTGVSAGSDHACGTHPDGTLLCWGGDGNGQLGQASGGDRLTPARVGLDAQWTSVSAGAAATCGVEAGSVLCWGRPGAAVPERLHDPAAEATRIVSVTTVGDRNAAIDAAGRLHCWADQ